MLVRIIVIQLLRISYQIFLGYEFLEILITTDAPHSTCPSCNLLQWIVGLFRYRYKIAKRRFLIPTGLFLLPTGRRVSLEGSDTVRILLLQKEILIESSVGFFIFLALFLFF